MKTFNNYWLKTTGVAGIGLVLLMLTRALVFGQTAPVMTIALTGTNLISITITNGINTGNYELWWTPVLGDEVDYPWTAAAVGTTGQTNFTLDVAPYQAGFFRALLDTNSVPLWEAADPNNPGAGILSVWIDSPANGATLN